MRIIMSLAVAMVGLGGLMAPSAEAAQGVWKCIGSAFVCATPSRAARSYVKRSYSKKATYRKTSRKKYSKKRRTSKRRYTGGGASSGIASYYWQPQRVASGGWFNPNALTAAHKTLPFGTRVRVTNKRNGRSVVVTINDRGPYIKGRVIDLSRRAAGVIGMRGAGIAPVSVSILGRG